MTQNQARHNALLVALLSSCAAALAQEAPVTTQELKDQWLGKTLVVAFPNGQSAKLEMRADSGLEITGAYNDAGKWRWHEPNGYCATWKKIRAGQERCFTVQRQGKAWQVINPDGSLNGTIVEAR